MVEASPTILSLDDSSEGQGLISFSGTNDLVMERNFRVPSHPGQPGDRISILTTGLGSAGDSSPGTMSVHFGDVSVGVESIETVSGHAGIFVVQVQVPAAIAFGKVPVRLEMTTADGRQFTSKTAMAVFEAAR
jgi:uncharacterized protein (TIGR03437 family)